MSTKNQSDNFITPNDRPFADDAKIFVAYETYEKLSAAGDPVVALRWLPVPLEDAPPDDERDGLFESFREEGANAARIEEGDVIDERLFTPDPDLPLQFIVTHPLLGCGYGNAVEYCTLEQARGLWPEMSFVGDVGGLLVIDRQTGPQYVGSVVRTYRERVADSLRDVPVIREGGDDKPPQDGSYIWVSAPGTHYRHDPDTATHPPTRIISHDADVIPYYKERCLWPSAITDWFVVTFGVDGAIRAAIDAVRIAKHPRGPYDPYWHFKQWGRQFAQQRRSLPPGEVLVDTDPDGDGTIEPGPAPRKPFEGVIGIPGRSSGGERGDRRTLAVCAARDSDIVAWTIDVDDLSEQVQSIVDGGELWGIYQTSDGGVVAEDRDGNLYQLEQPDDPVAGQSDESVRRDTIRRSSVEAVAGIYDELADHAEHGESGYDESGKEVARLARATADRLRLTAVAREAVTRPGHYGSGPVIVRYDDGTYDVIDSATYESGVWRNNEPYTVVIDWRNETQLVNGVPRLLDKSGVDLATYSDDELYEYIVA